VDCELAAVAFGSPAESLAKLPEGATVRCKGFLSRRYRTGISIALHIDEFETIETD
jgi:primosomal replication protein N